MLGHPPLQALLLVAVPPLVAARDRARAVAKLDAATSARQGMRFQAHLVVQTDPKFSEAQAAPAVWMAFKQDEAALAVPS